MKDKESTRKIRTYDGVEAGIGDRIFNYYDGKWGVIESIDDRPEPNTMKGQNTSTPQEEWDNYWFYLLQDDGSRCLLDGSRTASYEPKR